MANVNYRQIPDLLSARKPFNGNSMHAEYVENIEYISAGRLDNEEREILRSVKGVRMWCFPTELRLRGFLTTE